MGWTRQLAGLLICIAVLLALYASSVGDMVGIWSTSAAYNFLYLILPISLFVIWSRRALLATMAPRLQVWALGPLIAFAALWLVAHAAFLAVGEHVALVGMLLSLLLLFLGERVFRALLFPFALLWMLVPVGDGLMPSLVALTVFLSKTGLSVLGTPTISDGTILATGMGRYGVVEACSALPFIMGNLIITLVFANLNYRRFSKQVVLVAASVPVAIFANIVRIVAVVLVTEMTGGKTNLVASHVTFGWIIFAIAVALEILIAAQFADKPERMAPPARQEPGAPWRRYRKRPVILLALTATLVLAVPHVWLKATSAPLRAADGCHPGPLLAMVKGGSAATESDWRPAYGALPDDSAQGVIETPAGDVDLYMAFYQSQRVGHELVGWTNKPYDGVSWALHEEMAGPEALAWGMPVPDAVRLRGRMKDRRIVWTWYWVDGRFTGNPLAAKLYQAKAALQGHDPASAALLLSVAENFDPESARPKLLAALDAMGDPSDLMARVARMSCPKAAMR